jgi:hypothetical protein
MELNIILTSSAEPAYNIKAEMFRRIIDYEVINGELIGTSKKAIAARILPNYIK